MTITTYANIDLSKVTQEQLDRCTRILHENTGEVFYQVESESDPTVEYEVHYRNHRFTCTCRAGQEGFKNCKSGQYCKHVRWSLKHAEEYKQEQGEQSQIESYVRQGVDRETAQRVVYAPMATPTEQAIKRAQQAYNTRAFSLLK